MTRTAVFSGLELMELHIQTLFSCDAAGRLRAVNEFGEPPAPLFYMGRTREGNLWRFRDDLPAAVVAEVDRLCRAEPIAIDLASQPQNHAAIRTLLAEYLGRQPQQESHGPAYWIPDGQTQAADVVLISETNVEYTTATFPWVRQLLQEKEPGPVAAAIEQGQAVCICYCSRRPAEATEAGVETLEPFRGRGYATATVAAWAAAVHSLGCIPMYSTSWQNFASQAVARKLGMVFYGEDWSLR